MPSPRVGDPAPPLVAPALFPDGSQGCFDLSEVGGAPVVVAFYPADDSPVCTRQLSAYTEGIERLRVLEAHLVAVSPQGIESHRRFSTANEGFAFPLGADEDRAIAQAWGVLGPLGFYRRSVFVVDPVGVVRYAHRASAGLAFRSVDDLVASVRSCR